MAGDLISRSALLDALNKLYMAALRKTAHSVETIYELDHLSALVKDAPAVDAEPVRHGRWIWADDGYLRCSECTQKAPTTTQYQDEPIQTATSYCPNCGAKMDAEVEDDLI